MSNEEVKKVIQIFNKKFRNKTVNIIFAGTLEQTLSIKNFRYFISKNSMILLDKHEEILKIDLDWLNDLKFRDNSVKLNMESDYSITIDI